ncbi:STAS domain-containing protein [Pseudonocardia sp. KRD-184]|uniref:STAS domain-containing protein n=1 Tax=Pseudonocardia oceani TaxID=2792013 RepID=A0ABS6U383_9PSEU|nr:STAS domain-containing protein [Pseudonocardia oceani]MBW0089056.1 STAS domain-containing protein [Pseudonocardia oceani]MBW0094689.1 STAS domain-containing protein [Pseudonocardia oceani]MBW0107234.1 STAS domain-containing protein [Pseudonocardia oceani]MBW0119789.1 STAS domain-containing protein [Pseudonocardia oceani]MBW0126695.1 STAS domain-containing protein [Pseudonocardia oceani]
MTQHDDGDVRRVVLRGELDITTVDRADAEVTEAEASTPAMLLLDLSELTFVDSSGVRLVLLADDRARACGRRLAVRLGAGPALRVFRALGLLPKLEIIPEPAPGYDTS